VNNILCLRINHRTKVEHKLEKIISHSPKAIPCSPKTIPHSPKVIPHSPKVELDAAILGVDS